MIPRPLLAIGIGILGAACLAGGAWYMAKLPRWEAERMLREAHDGRTEGEAFAAIARQTRVHFEVFDDSGSQLPMSDFISRARRIRFLQYGSPPLEHSLFDANNVTVLMRE